VTVKIYKAYNHILHNFKHTVTEASVFTDGTATTHIVLLIYVIRIQLSTT